MTIHGNPPNSTFEWFYESCLQCYRIFTCAIVLMLPSFSCFFFILDMHTNFLEELVMFSIVYQIRTLWLQPCMYGSAKFCLQFLKIFGSTAVVLLSSVFLIPVITNYLQVNDLWCLLDAYMCGIHYKPHYYCEPCTRGSTVKDFIMLNATPLILFTSWPIWLVFLVWLRLFWSIIPGSVGGSF